MSQRRQLSRDEFEFRDYLTQGESLNPDTNDCQPVPRHLEIKELLAKHILRKLKVTPE